MRPSRQLAAGVLAIVLRTALCAEDESRGLTLGSPDGKTRVAFRLDAEG